MSSLIGVLALATGEPLVEDQSRDGPIVREVFFDNRSRGVAIDLRVHRWPGKDIHGWTPVAPVAARCGDDLHLTFQSGRTHRFVETGEGGGAAASRAIRSAANVCTVPGHRLVSRKERRSVKWQGRLLERRLRRE